MGGYWTDKIASGQRIMQQNPERSCENGVLLGTLLERSEQSLRILEQIRDHLRPPAAPPAPQPPGMTWLATIREACLVLLPLSILAAIVAGKLSASEGFTLLLKALALP